MSTTMYKVEWLSSSAKMIVPIVVVADDSQLVRNQTTNNVSQSPNHLKRPISATVSHISKVEAPVETKKRKKSDEERNVERKILSHNRKSPKSATVSAAEVSSPMMPNAPKSDEVRIKLKPNRKGREDAKVSSKVDEVKDQNKKVHQERNANAMTATKLIAETLPGEKKQGRKRKMEVSSGMKANPKQAKTADETTMTAPRNINPVEGDDVTLRNDGKMIDTGETQPLNCYTSSPIDDVIRSLTLKPAQEVKKKEKKKERKPMVISSPRWVAVKQRRITKLRREDPENPTDTLPFSNKRYSPFALTDLINRRYTIIHRLSTKQTEGFAFICGAKKQRDFRIMVAKFKKNCHFVDSDEEPFWIRTRYGNLEITVVKQDMPWSPKGMVQDLINYLSGDGTLPESQDGQTPEYFKAKAIYGSKSNRMQDNESAIKRLETLLSYNEKEAYNGKYFFTPEQYAYDVDTCQFISTMGTSSPSPALPRQEERNQQDLQELSPQAKKTQGQVLPRQEKESLTGHDTTFNCNMEYDDIWDIFMSWTEEGRIQLNSPAPPPPDQLLPENTSEYTCDQEEYKNPRDPCMGVPEDTVEFNYFSTQSDDNTSFYGIIMQSSTNTSSEEDNYSKDQLSSEFSQEMEASVPMILELD